MSNSILSSTCNWCSFVKVTWEETFLALPINSLGVDSNEWSIPVAETKWTKEVVNPDFCVESPMNSSFNFTQYNLLIVSKLKVGDIERLLATARS